MNESHPQGEERLTIDELAARVGMTARNIRAHQSRGLLPPPHLRAEPASTAPSTSPG